MAQSGNPQEGFSLFGTLMTFNNAAPKILSLDYNWTQTWAMVKTLAGGKSRGFTDKDGIYRRSYQKRDAVLCQIATATQSGANLLLTLVDSSYTGFRLKDNVKDDNMNEGRVIDASIPGKILVAPGFTVAGVAGTLTAGTQFVVGQTVRAYQNQAGNFNSAGVSNLYRQTTVQTDYSEVTRESYQVARREQFNTHLGTDGVFYLWSEGEEEMLRRAHMAYTKKVWFGHGGTQDSVIEGRYNGTIGIRDRIINDGAYISSTAPLTQAIFEELFFSVAAVDGAVEQELTLYMGRNALRKVQGFYSNYIQYAGNANTFGGQSVQGINVMMVKIAGVMCKLVILGFLSDSLNLPAWNADSIYIMDMTPLPGKTASGQMTTESPLLNIHWGDGDTDEWQYNIISGMPSGMGSKNGNGATYKYSSNAIDGTQFEVLFDDGVSYIGTKSALFEQPLI